MRFKLAFTAFNYEKNILKYRKCIKSTRKYDLYKPTSFYIESTIKKNFTFSKTFEISSRFSRTDYSIKQITHIKPVKLQPHKRFSKTITHKAAAASQRDTFFTYLIHPRTKTNTILSYGMRLITERRVSKNNCEYKQCVHHPRFVNQRCPSAANCAVDRTGSRPRPRKKTKIILGLVIRL